MKELAEENLKYFSQLKLRLIEKIMRRAVYLHDEHLLLIYKFSKVVSGIPNLNDIIYNYDSNYKKADKDNVGSNKNKKNDSNLSLNSTPNSKIENNSDWGIEEKCILFF